MRFWTFFFQPRCLALIPLWTGAFFLFGPGRTWGPRDRKVLVYVLILLGAANQPGFSNGVDGDYIGAKQNDRTNVEKHNVFVKYLTL